MSWRLCPRVLQLVNFWCCLASFERFCVSRRFSIILVAGSDDMLSLQLSVIVVVVATGCPRHRHMWTRLERGTKSSLQVFFQFVPLWTARQLIWSQGCGAKSARVDKLKLSVFRGVCCRLLLQYSAGKTSLRSTSGLRRKPTKYASFDS